MWLEWPARAQFLAILTMCFYLQLQEDSLASTAASSFLLSTDAQRELREIDEEVSGREALCAALNIKFGQCFIMFSSPMPRRSKTLLRR